MIDKQNMDQFNDFWDVLDEKNDSVGKVGQYLGDILRQIERNMYQSPIIAYQSGGHYLGQ